MPTPNHPPPPVELDLTDLEGDVSDREVLRRIHEAMIALVRWSRLSKLKDSRSRAHQGLSASLCEKLDEAMRDKYGTPLFSAEEQVSIFFGSAVMTLYSKVFPDKLDQFVKTLERVREKEAQG